jgi:hypothetical protein
MALRDPATVREMLDRAHYVELTPEARQRLATTLEIAADLTATIPQRVENGSRHCAARYAPRLITPTAHTPSSRQTPTCPPADCEGAVGAMSGRAVTGTSPGRRPALRHPKSGRRLPLGREGDRSSSLGISQRGRGEERLD